jgi:glycosidase
VADWSDVVDLDYSQESLREFMITAMGYWVSEADVDGFRCDVAGMVPTDFWQAARPRLEEIKPLFMLAEWEDPTLAGPFEMSYGWNLHRAGNAYMKGTQDVDGLDSLLRSEAARWPAGHLLMRFITNHDENSWNGTEDERLGAAADAFGVLAWTLPGMPLLYNGQEAGLDRRLAFFEKDEILWACHPRRDLYTQLNRLKHLSPALWSGATDSLHYQRVDCGPAADQVWAFLRFSEAEDLLCVVNLGPEPVELSLTDARLRGTWRVWEDGARLENKASLELKIPAWGWSILRRSAL